MKKQIRSNIEKLTNTKIESIVQVNDFIEGCMFKLKLNFHPDTPFSDYVGRYNVTTFSNAEQEVLENSLQECFKVCGNNNVDIYGICLEVHSRNLKHDEKDETYQRQKTRKKL